MQEVNYVIDTLQLELEEQQKQESQMVNMIKQVEYEENLVKREKMVRVLAERPKELPQRTIFVNRKRLNFIPQIKRVQKRNKEILKQPLTADDDEDESECLYDTIVIDLPNWFSQSANPEKSIELEYIHLYQYIADTDTWTPIPSTMHSDLVQFYKSADNYVCSTNMMYSFPKKFIIGDKKDTFDMWFRDMAGYLIDLDTTKTRVILELVLRY